MHYSKKIAFLAGFCQTVEFSGLSQRFCIFKILSLTSSKINGMDIQIGRIFVRNVADGESD